MFGSKSFIGAVYVNELIKLGRARKHCVADVCTRGVRNCV